MSDLVFVVSLPRSGSTFLAAAVGSHPEVGLTNEAGWVAFLRKASLLASTPSLETIDDGEGFVTQGLVPLRYAAAMRQSFGAMVQPFVDDFYRRAAGQHRYYADKIHSHNDVQFVVDRFPDARILHLVREPRDVVVSSFAIEKKQVMAWQGSSFESRCRDIARFERVVGELLAGRRCHRVCYEELVADPAAGLSAVLDFLELEPSEQVEAYLDGEATRLFSSHGTSRTPAASVGRWRADLDEDQKRMADEIFGPVAS